MNVVTRTVRSAFKAASKFVMRFNTGRPWSVILGRTRYDYSQYVGDGLGNSLIVAAALWIARNFPEAPVVLVQRAQDGSKQFLTDHPFLDLLAHPNDYYSGVLLWFATLLDYTTTGNAYWIKLRNGHGRPVQLWYCPSWLIEPKWPSDGSEFISHYAYKPGGESVRVEVEDVVHFRNGLDPHNPRLGLSPLGSLFREIFTDDEAANFSAALLRNLGVPGVVITPDADDIDLTPEDAKTIKEDFAERFGGDNRGKPMVLNARAKVQVLSFSPEQMDVRGLRSIPEERVAAVIGIPAAVLGFGSGLAQTKVGATMAELRELAYENNIIPSQRLMSAELKTQLLVDFTNDKRLDVGFDTSVVRVLQEDQNKLWARVNTAVQGGWMTVAAGKVMVGQPVEEGDEVYLRSTMVTAVPPGSIVQVSTVPLLPSPSDPASNPADGDNEGDGDDPNANNPTDLDNPQGANVDAAEGEPSKVRRWRWFEHKATVTALEEMLQHDRVQHTKTMATDLESTFQQIAKDVRTNIASAKGWGDVDRKAALSDDTPIPEDWPGILVRILGDARLADLVIPHLIGPTYFRPLYQRQVTLLGQTTFQTLSAALGIEINWNFDDPNVVKLVKEAGERISLVDAQGQTREALLAALKDGLTAGDDAEAVQDRIESYVEGRNLYPGLYDDAYKQARANGASEDAADEAGTQAAREYRARTISQTETSTMQNKAAVAGYRVSGIVDGVRVSDGVDFDDACREANGQVWTLDQAEQNPLQHPKCQRSFLPILRGGS